MNIPRLDLSQFINGMRQAFGNPFAAECARLDRLADRCVVTIDGRMVSVTKEYAATRAAVLAEKGVNL